MSYSVKEIFYSLQGEGAQCGHAAVFCRFAGCNLWDGKENSRDGALCGFCDTDFRGIDGKNGGRYSSAEELMQVVAACWPGRNPNRLLIFTGGEPMLQLNQALVNCAKAVGFSTALETNGSLPVCSGLDWITVSPKANVPLVQKSGSELKLVYPIGLEPADFEMLPFNYFYLSPLWSKNEEEYQQNLELARDYCLAHPKWRLTMQAQRLWRLP